MGRLFLLEFDQTDPNIRFYFCRICKTHISNLQHHQYFDSLENGSSIALFEKAINVQVDGPAQHRILGTRTAADVYCNKCGDLLGWKFVEVPVEALLTEKDSVQLLMAKLLYWNGSKIIEFR